MNQNSNHKFSDEERNIFKSIADYVQANPNDYKEAGEWLDEYCSESAYWLRQEDELEKRKKLHGKFHESIFQRQVDQLENEIKERRTPALGILFHEARKFLLEKYQGQEFLSKEVTVKIILITWLLTDADAQKANLHITEFEKWEWEPLDDILQLSRGYAGILFTHNKVAWMSLVCIAWGKIKESEKKESVLGPKPPEIFAEILWVWKHGRQHWKLVCVGILVFLISGILVLPKFNLFGNKYQGTHLKTENTLHKPIVVARAAVEVKITSDWDFNGIVANTKAYLAFVKGNKPLLMTSSIGYTASQIGNDVVVYKAKLGMDAKDSAVGNLASFLLDTEFIQIEFGNMPSDSDVLGGDVICIINNSVRLIFSIPPQKLVNNQIFIRDLSESLQVLNEPGN